MSTPPFIIPIGTSDPLNLCKGLPLFSTGTARAGSASSSRSYALIDTSATILATRLQVSAYASYAFGICGPAIAFLSRNVEGIGTNTDGGGTLSLTFKEGQLMQAGAFVAAAAGAGVTLSLQVYKPDPWYKPWAIAWRDAFSVDIGVSVDLLKLLYDLIRRLLGGNPSTSFTEDSENMLKDIISVKDFNLTDTIGSSDTVQPDLRATPGLILPINIANYFPPLKAINAGLTKVGGEISVGPSLHLQFPVTFNYDYFTVDGGLLGPTSADYGKLSYVGSQIIKATGDVQFNTQVKPTRVTTHVRYYTSFTLAISFHFRVTLAKFFNFEVNTRSLDLVYLLFGTPESNRSVHMNGSVSTNVEGGCVLTPNMTLTFTGPNGTTFQAGETLKGTISVPLYTSSTPATIILAIEPPVPGFPTSTSLPADSQTAFFDFAFPNQRLSTGNPNDPSETVPAGPESPLQTYRVAARLQSPSNSPCSDYEVEVALNIANRFLWAQRISFTSPGTTPPWDPASLAGASLDPKIQRALPLAGVSCWFPYLDNEPNSPVPIRFTLLDENRLPHTGSNVVIRANGQDVLLNPSASASVTVSRSYQSSTSSFSVIWNSQGTETGYLNRFFLIVDAGEKYGQTEFWLDVWNWS
jgi:hypothetical protein